MESANVELDGNIFRVKLIALSRPIAGFDPRRIVVLAVKVSQGKLHEKDWEYYLTSYPDRLVSDWIRASPAFPSVLEHISFTFLIEGISRVCSHQLVRHRIASYTQESQRYSESYAKKALEKIASILIKKGLHVSKSKSKTISKFLEVASDDEILEVAEEAFVIPSNLNKESRASIAKSYLYSLASYYELIECGTKPEDARFVLPQAVKTRLLMTVNLRELIHIACLRISPRAQWEIREVVKKMIDEVRKFVPEIDALIEKSCRE